MKIPESNHTISAMIDKYHEQKKELPRPHIGASALGHVCDRFIWLSFRWSVQPKFPGRILRLFRRGQNEEATIISDLRAIGMNVRPVAAQHRVDFCGHVSGSLDAIIDSGVPEAPKKKHIAEFKTHCKKSFDALVKDGVEKSKPMHFIQMQVYMHGTDIDRALYFGVCKDDDRIHTERIRYDKDVATKAVARGQRIAMTDRIPEPISENPSWYQCKLCDGYKFCHQTKTTEHVNCRTCAHSTARPDTTWHCARWDDVIPLDAQSTGCAGHVLHPDLVPWKLHDGEDRCTAVYEIDGLGLVSNGDPFMPGVFSSRELLANAAACASASGDLVLTALREECDGRIVG